MNVTEKQKDLMIRFMQQHPDFGRGRLRYNKENKRKIDELWEKLSVCLNKAAYGPQKSAKEWAKTWRDWKSNTLKKVAKQKIYMMGTGGGSPKELQLCETENALLNFLSTDASGLRNIPEGGFTNDLQENVMPSYDCDETLNSTALSYYNTKEKDEDTFSHTSNDVIFMKSCDMNFAIHEKQHNNMQDTNLIENNLNLKKRCIQQNTKVDKCETIVSSLHMKNVCQTQDKENWVQDKTCALSSDTEDYIAKHSKDAKKLRPMTTAINLLEKKSFTSENIKKQMLQLKKENLEVKKEELSVLREILQQLQNMNNFISSLREELLGQYLITDLS